MEIQKIEDALKILRSGKKKKFIQTLDLIINLQNFDVRKESVNTFVKVPNTSGKKICGFLTKKTKIVDSIVKEEFDMFKNPREIKRLADKYDFFIAAAPLMSAVATKFGRVLGPVGKMPSPQAGIITSESDESIQAMVDKMNSLVRVRTKESSIKFPIGKEDLSDKELKENIEAAVSSLEAILPRKNDNIKNVLIKFTMTKPERIR